MCFAEHPLRFLQSNYASKISVYVTEMLIIKVRGCLLLHLEENYTNIIYHCNLNMVFPLLCFHPCFHYKCNLQPHAGKRSSLYSPPTTSSIHSSMDQISTLIYKQFTGLYFPVDKGIISLFYLPASFPVFPHLTLSPWLHSHVQFIVLGLNHSEKNCFAVLVLFWLYLLHPSPYTNKSMCLGLFPVAEPIIFSLLINQAAVCLEEDQGLRFQQSLCGYLFQMALLSPAQMKQIRGINPPEFK